MLDNAGLQPLPPMSLARAGQDFLPFLRAGSAVLARTTLLLGTKTIATAVATRCVGVRVMSASDAHEAVCHTNTITEQLVSATESATELVDLHAICCRVAGLHANCSLMATVLTLNPNPTVTLCRSLGTVPVAAHQVVYQLWIFASFVIDSLAIAGQTLIAIALGAGRPREAREIADRLLEARRCAV